jgi:hypothetical protein
VILLADIARCAGKPAGASGHQVHPECVNCWRRLAPRGGYFVLPEPPKDSPCPIKLRAKERA